MLTNLFGTNRAFGLYPLSGVSKIEELKIYIKYHNYMSGTTGFGP